MTQVAENHALVSSQAGAVATPAEAVATHPASLPVRIDPAALAAIKDDIQLLEEFVQDVLEREADWGRVPGIPQPFLWEPGADKITAAYKCYARPIVLKADIDELKKGITYIVQAELVSRNNSEVVATGIGVASTKEGKWGSRWVPNPEDYGYDSAKLRKKADRDTGELQYRIPNPDWGDLVHTLMQMAFKRSKADAAQSLPGVSSSLRRLFGGKAKPEPKDEFPHFWGEMRALNISRNQVHQYLGVKSLYDWLETHSIKEARELILARVVKPRSLPPTAEASPSTVEASTAAATSAGSLPIPEAVALKEGDIQSYGEMFKLCFKFWKMQPEAVVKEMGYKSRADIKESPWECFTTVRAARS